MTARRWKTLFIAVLLSSISGCTLRLISDYDEVIDKAATDLHKKVEAFLVKMEGVEGKPEAAFSQNTSFYESSKVALSAMLIRAEAREKNELTIKHIKLIEENIENLRKLHEGRKDAGMPKSMIGLARDPLNAQFRAIIKLELAKKRGE